MIAALTLLLIATAPAGQNDGLFVYGNGNSSIRRAANGVIIESGDTWMGTLTHSSSKVFEGTLVYAPDSGRLYAQGGDEDSSWVIRGECVDDKDSVACDVTAVALSDDTCQAHVSTAYWQPSKTGQEQQHFTIGGLTFAVDWGGTNMGYMVEVDVELHNSSHDDGEVDQQGTLQGIYDTSNDVMSLSWWNDRLCDGFVIQQQADCNVTGSGRMNCRGDADVWLNRLGTTTSLSFWGYDNMTTAKGI